MPLKFYLLRIKHLRKLIQVNIFNIRIQGLKKWKNFFKVEKRQQKIEEERIKREINSAQLTQASPLVQALPSPLTPYIQLMRMDKPKPTLLVLWPGVWGLLGATSYLNLPSPDLYLLSVIVLGAFFSRSAGCIINDIWDRKIDAQVERTQNRPLASGRIGLPAAFSLLGLNLAGCLACLMQLNLPTQVWIFLFLMIQN